MEENFEAFSECDAFSKALNAISEGSYRGVQLLLDAEAGLDVGRRSLLAEYAGYRGEIECLRVLLRKGITLNGSLSRYAAEAGNVPCLRLAYEFGDRWTSALIRDVVRADVHVWLNSPSKVPIGRTECLNFLIKHNCPVDEGDGILFHVVRGGHLDSVRLLDSKGVGLWEYACNEEDIKFYHHHAWARIQREKKVLAIPQTGKDANHMSKALLYGWSRGAPVTPAMEAGFKAKRAATRATLLCFHVATPLSKDEGTPWEQREVWSVMGRVPMLNIAQILIHADYEIEETVYRSLPKSCRASVLYVDLPILVWTRNVDDWWEAILKWRLYLLNIFCKSLGKLLEPLLEPHISGWWS